ncbi:MAG: hypothetical protein U0V02_11260 [Anaerolineales bacterium]
MKKITYIFLSFVFLASCTNLSSLNATATPQATFTLTSTFTPTITPTITSTPTETPDPNKPIDATDKDLSTGEYTKNVKENGKTVVYIWKQFQFGDDAKNGIAGHWFKSWMANGSINLTEYEETCKEMWEKPFALNMSVYAVEGQADLDKIGYLFRPDREAEWNKYTDTSGRVGMSCSTVSLPHVIISDLFLRYINLLPNNSSQRKELLINDYYYPGGELTGERAEKYANDRQSFIREINDGTMIIKVGNENWLPKNGYEIYWIDESMVVNDPTMIVSLSSGTLKDYYLKVTVKDGKLIVFIAPSNWLKEELVRPKDKRERIFKSMILFPLEAAITSTFPVENASFLPFQDYQGKTGIISGAINGQSIYIDIPFIDFTPTQ